MPSIAGGFDAALHRCQDRLVTIATEDVDDFRRVAHQPPPAIGVTDLSGVHVVEANAFEHDAARRLNPPGNAEPVGRFLYGGCGAGDQGYLGPDLAAG